VAIQLAHLMLARVLSWLALLARSDVKDVEILVLVTRSPVLRPRHPTPKLNGSIAYCSAR
jgi:hypothetical protein